ncbi:ABC transporter ATP-binding protein [Candidatus Entotheonella palauensis]|uniref:Peptide ABC transporter ATP-binding protein n=1 Tax=Candidatus Entotheonella gemina TaxID=1429439 RepID=W4MDQ5_9BACT|nr:ABC transporter ATP-binding protein [Candidatus Entotheonella palauensis]ETX08071.1 MAG: peptide ABC transporter ATP-binding protein [Candidatus Entotheonella gemina]
MAEPLLAVNNLQMHLFSNRGERVVKAVDGVSFTLSKGETMGIVGESGSGKTMTSLSILRLLPTAGRIVGGEIRFAGEDLLGKSDQEMQRIRGSDIAMILQDPMMSLNPLFTIGEQIAEPLRVHRGMRGAGLFNRLKELLNGVRIPSPEARLRDYPHQMSGGMRQRIVGAIGISCEPSLLIADEPTTSLDVTIQAQYLRLLKDIQQRVGLAMMFITHDIGIVAKMCDYVAVMYAGKLVERAPMRTLFREPKHPYTEALLKAVPRLNTSADRLWSIEGQPPDLSAIPPGCPFSPRCPVAEERCRHETPPEFCLGPNHYARCWLRETA